jgi:hypothetical protein
MGGILGGGGKKVKAPTPQKAAPVPTVATDAEDEALQRAKGAGRGFESTIITGSLVPKSKGKFTRLGGR